MGRPLRDRLRSFDWFPKVASEYTKRSKAGGVVTVVVVCIIGYLVLSEFGEFLTPVRHYGVGVDVERTHDQNLNITLDMTVAMRCEHLSVDVIDVSGLHVGDVSHELFKQSVEWKSEPSADEVDSHWKEAGHEAVGTYDEVVKAVKTEKRQRKGAPIRVGVVKTEGASTEELGELRTLTRMSGDLGSCRIYGHILVNKIKGNFHIAPGVSRETKRGHVHDIKSVPTSSLNFTHRIETLTFGEPVPGVRPPLEAVNQHTTEGLYVFQYYLQVVPTLWEAAGEIIDTNQYSVTTNRRPVPKGHLPGIVVNYDLAPVRVSVGETSNSFLHFLTRLCAIVGGVFAVSGMAHAGLASTIALFARVLGLERRGGLPQSL